IVDIASDGSWSTLATGKEWRYVELGPDGRLYATVWAGAGQGVYQIDRTTGQATIVKAGGPAANGDGVYFDLAFGLDGKLYTLGDDTGAGANTGLFRLDGSTFTRVASVPHT